MKFHLRLDMNGAAFDAGAAPAEVARILRTMADEIADSWDVPGYFQNVRDINGNICGQWAAKPDDYKPGCN